MTDIDSSQRDDGILKRDVLGRVRSDVRRREALLDEFERSGLSGPKFAALAGLCYQTFAAWLHKRRRQRRDDPVRPLRAGAVRRDAGPVLMRCVEAETEMGSPLEMEMEMGMGMARVTDTNSG